MASHPMDGTPLTWLVLAPGLSVPRRKQQSVFPTMRHERPSGLLLHSTRSSSPESSPTFVLGTFYFFASISVFISFSTLHFLSTNRQWISTQGDYPIKISVLSWMRKAHSEDGRAAILVPQAPYGKATTSPIPGRLLPHKPGNLPSK